LQNSPENQNPHTPDTADTSFTNIIYTKLSTFPSRKISGFEWVGCGQISRQSNFPVVIPSLRSRTSLSGTQWSEESLIFSKARSFAEFTLERSEGLRMTKECNSLLIMGLQDARKISHTRSLILFRRNNAPLPKRFSAVFANCYLFLLSCFMEHPYFSIGFVIPNFKDRLEKTNPIKHNFKRDDGFSAYYTRDCHRRVAEY